MFNVMNRTQGWCDSPLTPHGTETTLQLGRALHNVPFRAAYSSDSGRARQSARLVLTHNDTASRMEVQECAQLREMCFGSYEGGFDDELFAECGIPLGFSDAAAVLEAFYNQTLDMQLLWRAVKSLDTSGMAEDFAEVKARTQNRLRLIAQKEAENGGGDVLLVSHGCAIMAMISDLTETPQAIIEIKNASVTKVVYRAGEFSIVEVGRVY